MLWICWRDQIQNQTENKERNLLCLQIATENMVIQVAKADSAVNGVYCRNITQI